MAETTRRELRPLDGEAIPRTNAVAEPDGRNQSKVVVERMANTVTLPWPPRALSPNAIPRNKNGWLVKSEKTELSDFDEANRLFSYNPTTGAFIRKVTIGMRAKAGSSPGHINHGYLRIRFRGKTVEAHRLAWLLVHGAWPPEMIDHINGNRSDNRISNLRLADYRLNMENQRRARSDNRLGVLGVRVCGKKYEARIWVNGSPKTLGVFETIETASEAYVAAKRKLHRGCSI